MSTQEQATLIGQELERKLSIFEVYSVKYDNITDDEDFYVEIEPIGGEYCITDTAMSYILDVVKNFDFKYFISSNLDCKPRISIY